MSLNPPEMSLQLKSSNAVSPPDFSRQSFVCKTQQGYLRTSNAFQISDSGNEMAGKLSILEPTKMIQCSR